MTVTINTRRKEVDGMELCSCDKFNDIPLFTQTDRTMK
jgi:hypothetical protein